MSGEKRMPTPGAKGLTAAAAILLVACGERMPEERKMGPARRMHELLGRLEEEWNGRIELSGRVTDDRGTPLSGVTVLVTRSAFSPDNESFGRDEEERLVVDERFELSCDRCRSIRLVFLKDGHYDETVDVSVDEAGPEGKARVVRKTNVEVALRAVGRLARLLRYSGYLESGDHGVLTVLPLEPGFDGGTARVDRFLATGGGDLESALAAAGPSLYLRAPLAEDGRLAIVPGSRKEPWHAGVPAPATLRCGWPGDGLRRFQTGGGSAPQKVFRTMVTAPTEGYESELPLDTTSEDPVYFFCRIGGHYGKGKAQPPIFAGTRSLISSGHCEVWLNAEPGDTNLESY
jgi:hypothetical protein